MKMSIVVVVAFDKILLICRSQIMLMIYLNRAYLTDRYRVLMIKTYALLRALERIFQWGKHHAMWGPLAHKIPLFKSNLYSHFFIYIFFKCVSAQHIFQIIIFYCNHWNACDAKYVNTYDIPGAVMLNCGGAGARRKKIQMWQWNCENLGLI